VRRATACALKLTAADAGGVLIKPNIGVVFLPEEGVNSEQVNYMAKY